MVYSVFLLYMISLLILLLLGGDIQLNPGPVSYPCSVCLKPVRSNQAAIQYDGCFQWMHCCCSSTSVTQYVQVSVSGRVSVVMSSMFGEYFAVC